MGLTLNKLTAMSIQRLGCLPKIRSSAIRRRHFSDVPTVAFPSYHSKVRALPFAFSPEEACSFVGGYASGPSNSGDSNEGQPDVPPPEVSTSTLTKYSSMSENHSLKPIRVLPYYIPTWFVSAELEATVWRSSECDGEEPQQSETGSVQFEDLYLPGTNVDLERLIVCNPPMDIELAQPFSPDLARQWGLDVTCIPYTFSPFDIFDKIRDLSYTDAVIDKLRFDPQSVKIRLAAAYPVLSPLYILEFTSKESSEIDMVYMPAHSALGSNQHTFRVSMSNKEDDVVICITPDQDAKASFPAIVINPGDDNLPSHLSLWLATRFYQPDALASVAGSDKIDMEDHRICEWTQDEVDPVWSWLRLDQLRADALRIFEGFLSDVNRMHANTDEDKSQGSGVEQASQAELYEDVDSVYSWLRLRSPDTPDPSLTKLKFLEGLYKTALRMEEQDWQTLFRAPLKPYWLVDEEESQQL